MLRFFADASLRGVYVRALRRSFPGIDLITAHEAGLLDAPDDLILDHAAAHGRITEQKKDRGFITTACALGEELAPGLWLQCVGTLKRGNEFFPET